MAGGIQPGTCATSTASKQSENKHNRLVAEVIKSMGPHWEIRKSLPIREIMGRQGEYSKRANGESQEWNSDGGFIYYRGKLVGVCENKWQQAKENACERVCKYLTFLPARGMFVSCEGPGFKKIEGGGSTGPLIDMLRHAGATVLENVSDETEYRNRLKFWIQSLGNV